MLSALKFNWLCLKEAWRGSWSRANETSAILGGGLLWGALWLLRSELGKFGMVDAPTTTIGVASFALASAMVCVILAFATVFLIRLLTAPSRLYSKLKNECEELDRRIAEIGLERRFSYDHVDFTVLVNENYGTLDLGACVYFNNRSDKILRWRIIDAGIEVNGLVYPAPFISNMDVANGGDKAWFRYGACHNVPFEGWPIIVNLMFKVEYDNMPSIRRRAFKRITQYIIQFATQINVPSSDVLVEEE
jgi:hypothetical protein